MRELQTGRVWYEDGQVWLSILGCVSVDFLVGNHTFALFKFIRNQC